MIVLLVISAGVNCYVFWLYHQAHGNEGKAVDRGAEIVLATLAAQGNVAGAAVINDTPATAFNMGEEDPPYHEDLYSDHRPEGAENLDDDIDPLDMIVSRNEKLAEQEGLSELNKVMEAMDDAEKEIQS